MSATPPQEVHFTYGGFGFRLKSQRTAAGRRYSLRAQTSRPWAEVADLAWPNEVHTTFDSELNLAVLVCHAAAQVPAEVGPIEALAPRLRLEGPIGEQAAAALEAWETYGGVECVDGLGNHRPGPCPPQRRRRRAWPTGAALFMASVLLTAQAARWGGWTRLGIIAAELVALVAWAAWAFDIEVDEPSAPPALKAFRGG